MSCKKSTNLSQARFTGVEEAEGEEDMVVEGCSTLVGAAVVQVRKSDFDGVRQADHLRLIDGDREATS